jgi:uncharacterized repeat protein (TIGR03843 family)
VSAPEPASGWPQRPPVPDDVARALLREGEVDLLGRLPWSSNATYLVTLASTEYEMLAVYKPQRGERPLWDFPRGTLCMREVAAFEISDALDWNIVPDTVLRGGPAGIGMMQRFVDHDPEEHYFTLLERHGDEFRRMAVFDIVINNTDRKGGHCLRATDGRVFGIDHGIAFHTQWKVRTVIWDFGGERIPSSVCADLDRLVGDLRRRALDDRLEPLLDRFERDALRARAEHLLRSGLLPEPDPNHHCYPWPMV